MNTLPAAVRTNPFLWAGMVLLTAGVAGNEWILTRLFSEDGTFSVYYRFLICVVDLYLIIGGYVLILRKDRTWVRSVGLAGLAFLLVPLLVKYVFRMGFLFQIDFNEGWNMYHTREITSGLSLYASRLTRTPVNYPPVSFYVIGKVGQFLHDPLMAGRLISLTSVLLISVGCGLIVHRMDTNARAAVFSGLFCLGLFVTYGRGYVGMDDPQLLGQAILLAGLIGYIHDRSRWLPIALVCCLGLFTKHNLLAIPLAISIDIFLRSRQLFYRWALACLVIGSGLLILTILLQGTDFLYQITAPRGFDVKRLVSWLAEFGPGMAISLLLTVPWLVQAVKDQTTRILPLYLVISIVWGLYTSGGTGTDINVFFDFFIGLTLAAGLSFPYLCTKLKKWDARSLWAPNLLPLLFSLCVLVQIPKQFPERTTFDQYRRTEQSFLEDTAYLASSPGPVICSNILLCYTAGHNFVFDPFLVTEGIFFGRYQEQEVLSQLETGYYPMVQLNYPLDEQYCNATAYGSVRRSNAIFTENFLRALGKNYVLTRVSMTSAFYEPRQQSDQSGLLMDDCHLPRTSLR